MGQITAGATPFPLGVFVGNPNYYSSSEEASFEVNFNAFSALMGARPQFLDQYADQRLPISQWVGQASWNAASVASSPVLTNITPVIGLPMTSTAPGSGSADQFYKEFAAGKYDSVLKGMIKAWADNGFTTQVWRPGWEMNVSTMPSYAGNDAATQADWVKAFQHIYTVLHAAGRADGVTIQVMWNPDVTNYSNAGNVIHTAYPGNQYVDIIGADAYADVFPYGSPTHLYDWDKSGQVLNSSHPVYDTSVQQWAADPVNLQHYYTNPASNQWSLDGSVGHATTLQQLIDLAKSAGKPLAVAETGAGNTHDGAGLIDNPAFVQWLAQTLHQSGVTVSFVNIWNSNSGGRYQFTNAADNKPLEAAAWAKYFGAAPGSTSTSSTSPTTASSVSNSLSTGDGTMHVNDRPAPPTIASYSSDSGVLGDRITNDHTLELKGTAGAGSTVEIYDGSIKIGATAASSTGSWDYITKVLVDAKHTLTATATNSQGQTSAKSSALAVTVDTKVPTAPTIVHDIVLGKHVVLSGISEPNSTLRVYDGKTQLGMATTDSSGDWSVTTPSLAGGAHTLTAKATDAAGNTSIASKAVHPFIGSSTSGSGSPAAWPTSTVFSPPKVSFFSKDSGLVGDHTTSDTTVTLNGSGPPKSGVRIFDGKTEIGTTTAEANGLWSYTTAPLPDGKHSFRALDTASGVSSEKSTALTITVDTIAPDAPVLLSASTHHHDAVVRGTAEASSTIKLYNDGNLLGTTLADAEGHFTATSPELKAGLHSITATATDLAGNISASSHAAITGLQSGSTTSTMHGTNRQQNLDHPSSATKDNLDDHSTAKLHEGAAKAGHSTEGAQSHSSSFQPPSLSNDTHAFTTKQVDSTQHGLGTSPGHKAFSESPELVGTDHTDRPHEVSDTLLFAPNFGRDLVQDLASGAHGHQFFDIGRSVFGHFASVLAHAAHSGDEITSAASTETQGLKNMKLGNLDGHEFHFG